jgi:hypothetical protein
MKKRTLGDTVTTKAISETSFGIEFMANFRCEKCLDGYWNSELYSAIVFCVNLLSRRYMTPVVTQHGITA